MAYCTTDVGQRPRVAGSIGGGLELGYLDFVRNGVVVYSVSELKRQFEEGERLNSLFLGGLVSISRLLEDRTERLP